MIPRSMRNKYAAHISSPKWKEIRENAIRSTYRDMTTGDPARGHYHCEKCQWNYQKYELEVHHLKYDSLGNEKRVHLAVVCSDCHKELDAIRAKLGAEKSAEALDNARFNGWAKNRYGDDWYEFHEPEQLYGQYLDWLERQGEG